jgi:hypothetical protein
MVVFLGTEPRDRIDVEHAGGRFPAYQMIARAGTLNA